jgi:hypothetical protein
MNEILEQRSKLEKIYSGMEIKCRTCAHCKKSSLDDQFDECMKAGTYCDLVNKFYLVYQNHCHNCSGWSPRRLTILELLLNKIHKILQSFSDKIRKILQ